MYAMLGASHRPSESSQPSYPPARSPPRGLRTREYSPSPRHSSSSSLLDEVERELGAPPWEPYHGRSLSQLSRRVALLAVGLGIAYSIRDHAVRPNFCF